MSICELNLHIRIKVWNLVHEFFVPYYFIKSMEALWKINAPAILGGIKHGRRMRKVLLISPQLTDWF